MSKAWLHLAILSATCALNGLAPAPCAAAEQAAQAKAIIQFDRPIAKGSEFDCEINASYSKTFKMSMPGVESPLLKSEAITAMLYGRMSVLEVNETGNPAKIRFQVKSLDGAIDHLRPELGAFQGKAFVADLTPPVCKFSMEGPDQAPMTKEATRLLSAIFRPATKSGMGALLGTNAPVALGDSWRPPCSLLLSMLAQRGLKMKEEDFDGSVTLKGRESFKSIDCWNIEERLDSKNVPGFDFRLNISLLLPVDPAKGGALKISRSGQEMVNKALPEGNPLSAGKTVEASVRDSMDAVVIPLR